MGDTKLTQYQYYGLVGKGVSTAGASITKGFGTSAALELQAGGYGMSAQSLDVQAEQELINAQMEANARMEQYQQGEAANIAITSAMGKTGENTTISDQNLRAAEEDVSLMKQDGKMRNISSRSGAVAARGQEAQANIASDAAMMQGIFGAVGGVASAAGSGSMMVGSTKAPTKKAVR